MELDNDPAKLILSLTKFMQHFCNSCVKFRTSTQLIGDLTLISDSQTFRFSVNETVDRVDKDTIRKTSCSNQISSFDDQNLKSDDSNQSIKVVNNSQMSVVTDKLTEIESSSVYKGKVSTTPRRKKGGSNHRLRPTVKPSPCTKSKYINELSDIFSSCSSKKTSESDHEKDLAGIKPDTDPSDGEKVTSNKGSSLCDHGIGHSGILDQEDQVKEEKSGNKKAISKNKCVKIVTIDTAESNILVGNNVAIENEKSLNKSKNKKRHSEEKK